MTVLLELLRGLKI